VPCGTTRTRHGGGADAATSVARVFVLRVVWGVCLAFGAMVMGVGIELYAAGAGRAVSIPVVVAGILVVPLAAAVIERFLEAAPGSDQV
jgi:hypothetical protein